MDTPYCVGIDVALHDHRVALLGPDGEARGKSFSILASQEGFAELGRTLPARAATPGHTLVGVEATGHFWENLEACLSGAGYRVVVLNPVQTRRDRDVLRRKAKTDDIDAYVIAGLLRSEAAVACYVPDEQIQSLRELARLRARLMRERQDYLRQLVAQLDVVFPEHRHDPIAHHLVHRALVLVDGLNHVLEDGVEDLAGLLGVAISEELHGALEVCEEYGNLLALALERGSGEKDAFSQMFRRVRLWGGETWSVGRVPC